MLYIIISLIVIILLIISIIISNNIVNIIFIKGDKPVLPVFKRAVEKLKKINLKKKEKNGSKALRKMFMLLQKII